MTNGTGKPKHLQEFTMTAKERDFEFCSGGEEDEYLEVEVHSPTDSSEDSVEVKVSPICLRNKRKCAEPRKVQDSFTAPPKKRMCFKAKLESPCIENPEPFRPWSVENQTSPTPSPKTNLSKDLKVPFVVPQDLPPPTTTSNFHIRPDQKPTVVMVRPQSPVQPLPLVKKPQHEAKIKTECDASTSDSCDLLNMRVPLHPHLASVSTTEAERLLLSSAEAFPSLHPLIKNDELGCSGRKEQRNYKNMTRERRIEANARERTRVHTISAAFETLRRSVPAYSHNQKLSKLSVLRIACSYIMTLSTLVSDSEGTGGPSSAATLAECIDSVSKTIQKEGKLRKKKDDTE